MTYFQRLNKIIKVIAMLKTKCSSISQLDWNGWWPYTFYVYLSRQMYAHMFGIDISFIPWLNLNATLYDI